MQACFVALLTWLVLPVPNVSMAQLNVYDANNKFLGVLTIGLAPLSFYNQAVGKFFVIHNLTDDIAEWKFVYTSPDCAGRE